MKLALSSLYWPQEDIQDALKQRQGKTRILDIGSGSGIWYDDCFVAWSDVFY